MKRQHHEYNGVTESNCSCNQSSVSGSPTFFFGSCYLQIVVPSESFCAMHHLLTVLAVLSPATVERWGQWERSWSWRPSTGNPFVDVELTVLFQNQHQHQYRVTGFYDGEDVFTARFMPSTDGPYTYTTQSNVPALSGMKGTFTVVPPTTNHGSNHGPVTVNTAKGATVLVFLLICTCTTTILVVV